MIKEYINYLQAIRGYSGNTAMAYEKDLRDFVKFLRENQPGMTWRGVTMAEIDEYVCTLVDKGLKPATTNRRLAAIAGFYNFMKRQGYDIENPCKFESRRKVGTSVPNTISVDELCKAYEESHGVAKVMLGLLASTGMRIQELLDLRGEDIDFKTQAIRLHGKGNKERIVYTKKKYLVTLAEVKRIGGLNGQIFTLDQRQARRLIYDALRPYSSARQLSPHAIRHTYATTAATKGANTTQIAHILGHQNISTTQKYVDLSQVAGRQTQQQLSLI